MVAVGDSGTHEISDNLLSPKATLRCCGEPEPRLYRPWLVSNRHGGGANMSFCDGHVEYAKRTVWIAATEAMRARWNRDHEPHPETWARDAAGQ
jgi:prepilin-type processing-associated H-X9-DG protein